MDVIGIDPGMSGGIALACDDGFYQAHGFANKTEVDIIELIRYYSLFSDICFLEKVHAMPKQGVVSSFTFGQIYGGLRFAILCHKLRMELVTPVTWQRRLKCLSKGDKKVTRAKAQQLFPNIKVTHQIADALLIAEYGRLTMSAP